jgi:hypothetical protein
MMYVDLCQAKDHLRVDHDSEDMDIQLKILQASSLIKSYLKSASPYEPLRDGEDNPTLDSSGEPEFEAPPLARYEVQAATLVMVQYLYDRDLAGTMTPGYLPDAVVSMLYPLRDPALA